MRLGGRYELSQDGSVEFTGILKQSLEKNHLLSFLRLIEG